MFRTELHIPSSPHQIGLSSRVVTAGSCFSDAIGQKLRHYKVDTLVNPFGTIFNPVSICRLIEMACSENLDLEERLVENGGIWYHYDLHSSFSSPDQGTLLQKIREALAQTKQSLQTAQLLILTFGTAYGYFLKDDGEVVANCHKIPDANFDRRLLTYYDMVNGFGAMCAELKMLNPELKVLLTVSPVRHLRETITGNSVSKANLVVGCHHIAEHFPDVSYFPSYEVMVDDLRDYRFYKDDMIHPSSLAEQYIWEKFAQAYGNTELQAFLKEWDQISRSLEHKPFHPHSQGHEDFLRDLLDKLNRLPDKVDVAEEIAKVKEKLAWIADTRPVPKPSPSAPADDDEEFEEDEVQEEDEENEEIGQEELERIEQFAQESRNRPEPQPRSVREPGRQDPRAPNPARTPHPRRDQEAEPARELQASPNLAKTDPTVETKGPRSKKSRNRRKSGKGGQGNQDPRSNRPQEVAGNSPIESTPAPAEKDRRLSAPGETGNQIKLSEPSSPLIQSGNPLAGDKMAPERGMEDGRASRPLKFIADQKKRNKRDRGPQPRAEADAPALSAPAGEAATQVERGQEPTQDKPRLQPAPPIAEATPTLPVRAEKQNQPEQTGQAATGPDAAAGNEGRPAPKPRGKRAPAKVKAAAAAPAVSEEATAKPSPAPEIVPAPTPAVAPAPPKAKTKTPAVRKPRKPTVKKLIPNKGDNKGDAPAGPENQGA